MSSIWRDPEFARAILTAGGEGAAVSKVLDRHLLEGEEGPDTEDLRPVAHRGFQITHDAAVLAYGSKNPAHAPPGPFTLTFWM